MTDDKPENGAENPPATPELEAARLKLSVFLDNHPNSTIEEINDDTDKRLGIKSPWGEDAMVIYLPDDQAGSCVLYVAVGRFEKSRWMGSTNATAA